MLTDEQKKDLEIFIEALRSGKYKQTTGGLHYVDSDGTCFFCAAGVACDLFRGEAEWRQSHFKTKWRVMMSNAASPPSAIVQRLPINWDIVMNMNDKDLKTFEEIATWLERTYLCK